MTRIVGGIAGGRRLRTPEGRQTRPTTDRVREAMFGSLEAELGTFDGLVVLDLYAGSGALGLEALSRGAGGVTFVESSRKALAVLRRNIATVALPGTEVLPVPVERALASAPSVPTPAPIAVSGSGAKAHTNLPAAQDHADTPHIATPGGGKPIDLASVETPGVIQGNGLATPADTPVTYDVVLCDPPFALSNAHLCNALGDGVRYGWFADDAVIVIERATRDGEPDWPNGLRPARSRRYGESTLWYGHREETGTTVGLHRPNDG